jgi:hypothetical protein
MEEEEGENSRGIKTFGNDRVRWKCFVKVLYL